MKRLMTLVTMAAFAVAVPAFSQVSEVTVDVAGLACPFCAYGLEKELKRVAGVGALVIDVKNATAVLTPSDGESIALVAIPRAVTNAGFTPRDVHVRATGRIASVSGEHMLLTPDGETLFLLQENDVLLAVDTSDDGTYDVTGTLVHAGDDQTLPLLSITNAAQYTEASK